MTDTVLPVVSSVWDEIAHLRERWDVVGHPYYQRWCRGGLRRGELQLYASEYHHAVVAVAEAHARAARLAGDELAQELERQAVDALEHIDVWMRFARGTGWSAGSAWFYSEEPYAETRALAAAWGGGTARSLLGHLVTLHAIAATQPWVSQIRLAGLLEHYGFDEGPATDYFRLHARMDHAPGALARAAVEAAPVEALPELLRDVEGAYRAYWDMLDRLEAECPSS